MREQLSLQTRQCQHYSEGWDAVPCPDIVVTVTVFFLVLVTVSESQDSAPSEGLAE